MAFTLPNLPYSFEALEPSIDARTMEIHLTKHHQTYVTKLNEAVVGTSLETSSVEDILRHFSDVPENIKTAVQNHGGGHANHCLFWTILSPVATKQSSDLEQAIETNFGGFENFKNAFVTSATARFGSGWTWLSVTSDKKLVVESTANQDSPIMKGNTPILGIDVWEHAYYLNYQNRRPDYIKAFMGLINWTEVSSRYEAAVG